MTTKVEKVRVFVASPGDVKDERGQLDDVVAEINKTLGRTHNIVVEVVKWETDVIPGLGRPQDVINKQIGEYDIFVGIMWKRFGTPTGKAESGTEEEFNHAYKLWKQHKRLHVLFYFCTKPFSPSLEEIPQVEKVLKFRKELSKKGLIWEYPETNSFSNTIRPHLINLISDLVTSKEDYVSIADEERTRSEKFVEARKVHPPIESITLERNEELQVPNTKDIYSSFQPERAGNKFIHLKISTTPGLVNDEWRKSSIYIVRDPIRPYITQIGETRSLMKRLEKGQFFHIDSFRITPIYCFLYGFAIPECYSTFPSFMS